MSTATKILTGFVVVFAIFIAGRFIYLNLIVPWPYRHELRACLEEARALDKEAAADEAENRCFRTYPHFN